MEVTGSLVKLAPFLMTGEIPETVIRKTAKSVWQVYCPREVDGGFQPEWLQVRQGDLVSIPLVPYRANEGFAAAGLALVSAVSRCMQLLPPAVTRIHWALGDRPTEVPDSPGMFRIWLGMAVQLCQQR